MSSPFGYSPLIFTHLPSGVWSSTETRRPCEMRHGLFAFGFGSTRTWTESALTSPVSGSADAMEGARMLRLRKQAATIRVNDMVPPETAVDPCAKRPKTLEKGRIHCDPAEGGKQPP